MRIELRATVVLVTLGCNVAAGSDARPVLEATPANAPAGPAGDTSAAASKPSAGPCPPEMAQVGAACVDRYEAHLVVARGDRVERHPAHERPAHSTKYLARSEAGVVPQAYISRVEAAAACANAGKRLCSVTEWYAACQGPNRTTYPYGARFDKSRCNVGKPHLLSRFFGTNPRAWQYGAHFNNPMLSQQPGFLAKTREYEGCVNDYGLFDMVGNLQEWVADAPDRSLVRKVPVTPGIRRSLGSGAGKGIFMGGFYSTTHEHGRGCAFLTAAHEVKYHDYSIGFRCCRDAK